MTPRRREARGLKQPRNVFEVCVTRAGLRRGLVVSTFIVQWATVEGILGRELGSGAVTAAVAEYREHWLEPERTVWQRLEWFREVFPDLRTPSPIAAALRERGRDRLTVADLRSVPLTALVG